MTTAMAQDGFTTIKHELAYFSAWPLEEIRNELTKKIGSHGAATVILHSKTDRWNDAFFYNLDQQDSANIIEQLRCEVVTHFTDKNYPWPKMAGRTIIAISRENNLHLDLKYLPPAGQPIFMIYDTKALNLGKRKFKFDENAVYDPVVKRVPKATAPVREPQRKTVEAIARKTYSLPEALNLVLQAYEADFKTINAGAIDKKIPFQKGVQYETDTWIADAARCYLEWIDLKKHKTYVVEYPLLDTEETGIALYNKLKSQLDQGQYAIDLLQDDVSKAPYGTSRWVRYLPSPLDSSISEKAATLQVVLQLKSEVQPDIAANKMYLRWLVSVRVDEQ